jgi:formylglycine-generating enzyme required for sulfatase activity
MGFVLLNCLARAAVKHGARFALNLVPCGEVVYDIASDAWEEYRRDRLEEAVQAELEALAAAPPEVIRQAADAAVGAAAPGQPAEVRQGLADYLSLVPIAIRRSLRGAGDWAGGRAPAELSLRQPADLVALLPLSRPRFRPGDRPLPGVDWVLDELLGVGGFGEVWKARHAHLSSKLPVALKFCTEAQAVPALRNEAGILDRVMRHGRHPGIVPLLQTYLSADPPCLEYEFIDGGDLAGLIRELHGRGELTCAKANGLLLALAEIVAEAHRSHPPIVHDDLKPANVLVRRAPGGGLNLYVTDFGIGGLAAGRAVGAEARSTAGRGQLLTEAVRGAHTPLYAAPEQMSRRRGDPADPRDDVHALGVIWYQLLTGDLGLLRVPADWREEVQARGLSEDLTALLAACLASRAERRPDDAGVLAARLRALMAPSAAPRHSSRASVNHPLGMRFAYCPPGTFLMGSPPAERGRQPHVSVSPNSAETQHRVRLSCGFYLAVHPVTRGQFARFVRETGYRTEAEVRGSADEWTGSAWQSVPGRSWRAPGFDQRDDHPVCCMGWGDVQAFCAWLTRLDGRTYRLPTEAQWEYACRSGTATPFAFGETLSTDLANYDGRRAYGTGVPGVRRGRTTPVGSFPPNAWGLHDMHGNVWEWCADWLGYYPEGEVEDPIGPASSGFCATRGGSWANDPSYCRSAHRDWNQLTICYTTVGFRVCFSEG